MQKNKVFDGKEGFAQEIPNGDEFQRKKLASSARRQRDLSLKEKRSREELPGEKSGRLRRKG